MIGLSSTEAYGIHVYSLFSCVSVMHTAGQSNQSVESAGKHHFFKNSLYILYAQRCSIMQEVVHIIPDVAWYR